MIRLAALACGALCGIGLALSGLFHPSVALRFLTSTEMWDAAFGVALLSALIVGGAILALGRALIGSGRARSLFGGEIEPAAPSPGWKAIAGGALFGAGLGITGYLPLTALVAVGVLAPGAVVFLTSVIAGMLLHDLVANRGRMGRISG